MKKYQIKAFTLVELIITITILAILATIGFMSYQQYTNEARDGNRITTLKTIYDGLTISYIKKQIYPTPDDYIDVVGLSKQGYVGETITQKLRGEGFKDPKDNTRYLYSLDYTGNKIQLSGYLENKDKILFSEKNTVFLNQVFAGNVDYTNRYIYTIGSNVGILFNSITNSPVNENISTGSIDLTTNTGTYTVVFSNTGSISGSGTSLLTNIAIIQNSCVLGDVVVINGGRINAYNTNTVSYNETCTPTQRTCTNGVLSGDISYKYNTCTPVSALNCSSIMYNGYSIPVINHDIIQNIIKNVIGGISNIDITCTNGVLSYGAETTTCAINYTLIGSSCVANTQNISCTGLPINASWNTVSNITQTWNGTTWLPISTSAYNITASTSDCKFKCNTNYTWNGTSCVYFPCGTSTVTAGGFTYTTKLGPDLRCWTSTNMKHLPSAGLSWCYNNTASYCTSDGRLYDWAAATSPSVCQALGTGWMLPTDAQWTTLTSAGATGWTGNKLSGIISSLPGFHHMGGFFVYNASSAYWWSSTALDASSSWERDLSSSNILVNRTTYGKAHGLSVICIKN